MYCFEATTHEYGQIQAKLDVMMWISCNDAFNSVECTGVHNNAQYSSLCSTVYCFGLTAHKSGQTQAKLDVMMRISCKDANNSAECTSVPQECSVFKLMQYNVLL
jgi:hypothetical protein